MLDTASADYNQRFVEARMQITILLSTITVVDADTAVSEFVLSKSRAVALARGLFPLYLGTWPLPYSYVLATQSISDSEKLIDWLSDLYLQAIHR